MSQILFICYFTKCTHDVTTFMGNWPSPNGCHLGEGIETALKLRTQQVPPEDIFSLITILLIWDTLIDRAPSIVGSHIYWYQSYYLCSGLKCEYSRGGHSMYIYWVVSYQHQHIMLNWKPLYWKAWETISIPQIKDILNYGNLLLSHHDFVNKYGIKSTFLETFTLHKYILVNWLDNPKTFLLSL